MDIETEVNHLDASILKMAGVVKKNLSYAVDVYLNYDPTKYYAPVDDDTVNAYERWIESDALHLLMKERLYAEDLRVVTGIMSMVQDLERLGDHAKDLLDFSLRLKNPGKANPKIKALADYVMKMVEDAIQSYIHKDQDKARQVILSDDHVDQEYEAIIASLIQEDDVKKNTGKYTVYTALEVKYLERIADHATNVAEWTIYILSGFYKDKQII